MNGLPSENTGGETESVEERYRKMVSLKLEQSDPLKAAGLRHAPSQNLQTPPANERRGTLRNIEVEFVRSPARGVDFDRRHNDLLITQQVVEALLSQNEERIAAIRQQISRSGGFLMRYVGVGEERLQSAYDPSQPRKGGWLMAETSAVPVNGQGQPVTAGPVLGADGQFYIPPDDETATSELFPLLDAHRDSINEGIYISEDIRTRPQSAMLIADIASVREYGAYGFAAATEDAVSTRLITEINTTRETVIRYILAAIASVKAVTDANNTLITPELDPGLRNWRSIALHTMRGRAAGSYHGKQVRHTVPVELPCGEPGHLLVDWWVAVQKPEDANIRRDITMRDEPFDARGGDAA